MTKKFCVNKWRNPGQQKKKYEVSVADDDNNDINDFDDKNHDGDGCSSEEELHFDAVEGRWLQMENDNNWWNQLMMDM